jgi:hypothetical protein
MSNDTLLREVDEALRGDRMRALWKRFGPYVIGAAVAIVVIVAVNEGWSWWQKSSAARSSDQFYAALELAEGTDIAAAQEALNRVAAEGSSGYPVLARFRQAGLLAQDGKTGEAIAAYDALATSQSDVRIRELALVLAGYLLVDGGDVAAVEQRVVGLLAPENPMRNAAREAMGLAQYKAGDVNAALASFEAILADPVATQELRGRIQVYVAQLIAEGAVSTTEPAAEAPSVGDAPALDVVPPAEGEAATPAEGEAAGD